jgi:hypothetical protein
MSAAVGPMYSFMCWSITALAVLIRSIIGPTCASYAASAVRHAVTSGIVAVADWYCATAVARSCPVDW